MLIHDYFFTVVIELLYLFFFGLIKVTLTLYFTYKENESTVYVSLG